MGAGAESEGVWAASPRSLIKRNFGWAGQQHQAVLVHCSSSGASSSDGSEADQRESSTGSTSGRCSSSSRCSSCSTTALTAADCVCRCGGSIPAVAISAADMQQGRYKTGVRYCLETWPNSIVLRGLDTLLATSSMFGYTATLLLIPVLAVAAYLLSSWAIAAFVIGITLSVFLPPKPLLWEGFQRSTLVSSWRRYFAFSLAVETRLDPRKQYIFAGFPHGVFPVSELLCISLMMRVWPDLKVYSIAASSVFKAPVWRHILAWTGARPATAQNFRQLLGRGCVSLVPGGIAEMFCWEAGREVVKVRDRKGFVRIAVEQGVPLVPVFHFGNSKLFSWVAPRSWEGVARRLRMALGYPKGRWGTLLPCNAPLFMAVGAPIPVPAIPRGAPGFEEAVDAAHAAFVEALEELYHKYKGYYGWQDRELVIK